jgi:hypothetical protein
MRRFPLAVSVLVLAALPAVVLAGPKATPAPSAAASPASADARDGGVIEGRVISVDYQRGTLSVDTAAQGKVDVSVMPSTSVQSDDSGYHTLTDVAKGSRVQIFISKSAGKAIAQIIRLIKH